MDLIADILPWMVAALSLVALLALATRRRAAEEPPGDPAAIEHLRAALAEAEAARRRAEEIIERMAEGVLVLDAALRPATANAAARALIGLAPSELPARLPSSEIAALARAALRSGKTVEDDIDLWFPERRTLHVRAVPRPDRDGAVVVLQDVTEALRTQRMRREFVMHASHELKTPVASLQALADALGDAARHDPDAAVRFADRLGQEAERLGRLIADLLDLSRLEDAARAPDDQVDLAEVVGREVAAATLRARDKGVQLGASLAGPLWVLGDDRHLALMSRNLLDNAVRYTPAGGRVTVTLARAGTDAVLRISDTGIGIPREAQGRIFERFYRVDRARARHRGGTGLGLAIVKHAVELHGGAISLDSELGRGSTFTISLPSIEPRRAAG